MSVSADMSVETSEETESTPELTLTAKDRCDACRSQAYFVVVLGNGSLYFCNHHYNKYYPELYKSKLVMDVIDESKQLFSKN